MISVLFRFGVGPVLLGLLAACDGHVYSASLSPIDLGQDCKSSTGASDKAWCTSLNQYGGSCTGSDNKVVLKDSVRHLGNVAPLVGFERKYDSGTDPLPCWKTGRWNSRAYVNFNVWAAKPQIESLAIATLSWQPSTKRFQAGIASNEPANLAPHCFKALHEGSLAWVSNGKRLLGDLITDDLTALESGKPITITPTVKKWVALGSGVLPSGLTFTARDENLSGDQNKYCWTTLNSLKLDVTYKAP